MDESLKVFQSDLDPQSYRIKMTEEADDLIKC